MPEVFPLESSRISYFYETNEYALTTQTKWYSLIINIRSDTIVGNGNGGVTATPCAACAPAEGNIVCYLIDVMKYRSEHFANYSSNVSFKRKFGSTSSFYGWAATGNARHRMHQRFPIGIIMNDAYSGFGVKVVDKVLGAADVKATHNLP